jgi:hypothetical protein
LAVVQLHCDGQSGTTQALIHLASSFGPIMQRPALASPPNSATKSVEGAPRRHPRG